MAEAQAREQANLRSFLGFLANQPQFQQQWRPDNSPNSPFASPHRNIPSPFAFADPPYPFPLQGVYSAPSFPPPPQQPFQPPQQPFRPSQQSLPFPYPSLPPPPPPQQPFPPPQQPFPPLPPPLPQQPFPPPQQPFQPPQQPFSFPPQPQLPPLDSSRTVTNDYYQYLPLRQAISSGDLKTVKAFLDEQPEAATASVLEEDLTALHFACHNGQVEIVKELLSRMSSEDVAVERDIRYHTPLTAAAINGSIEMAEALITKNPKLLEMPGNLGDIPVVSAVITDQKAMARYLYSKTPLDLLLDNNGYHGIMLLSSAIFFKMLDIALHLFQSCPRLAVTKNHFKGLAPLCVLASRPNLFPSCSKLGLWQRFIYSYVYVEPPSDRLETFDQPRDQGLLRSFTLYLSKFFGVHQMRKLKKTHLQAQKLLRGISTEVSPMGTKERGINGIFEAIGLSIEFGTVEFIVEMIRTNPELLRVSDTMSRRTLFLMAVERRQENIFSLLYGLGDKKAQVIADLDAFGNGILHFAGYLAPPSRLENIPGPALQLQRELQWFKEVESIVPDVHAERLNMLSLKPRDLFTACHANLLREAEKWMKDTATSCSLVAALIVTVTFAAAFTVPGGTDQSLGTPLRLKDNRLTFFIVSDIISFFSSCTSVLIFLGILTARYSEDDFLVSLPTKMIGGLSIMFFSIAAMLLAFSTALFTLLYHSSWIVIPVILLVCLPVILFILLQYPLLVTMITSTYGRGIFDRNMKLCL